jgi:DNA invertase Pin-like site-specific DNA recombinase
MGNTKVQDSRQALGYCRVSTTVQAELGVSLDAQTEKIHRWCTANGYELIQNFVDRGISGGRYDNRPALQEALQRISKGDSLVVYRLSRLARSTRDTLMIAETLERRGADLVSLSERIDTTSSAGKMLFRMLAVLSEFERDVISERTSMAMAHLKHSGRFTGGQEPYGYRSVDGVLQVVTDEMDVVHLIHHLKHDGKSLRAICRYLTERGITTRTGKAFLPIQVDRVLKGGRSVTNGDPSQQDAQGDSHA